MSLKRLVGLCKEIPDERRHSGNWRHRLADVLVICLLGLICGHETREEIYDYARAKRLFLWQKLGFKHGIPSPATLRRVMGMIDPEALESVYRQWVRPYIGSTLAKQACLDGKTLRGASRTGELNIHMVSAWIHEDRISMGQIRTEEKSNEITAIPVLLSKLDIRGGVVSIDDTGWQKAIAAQIIAQGAHYLLAVKGNQSSLHEAIEEYFAWAQADPIERKTLQVHTSLEKGHGRVSKWRVYTCDALWFEGKASWPMLRSFVCVERSCTKGEVTSHERAFFISSLEADAQSLGRHVRNHWGVENRLHWMLDVCFDEDASLLHDKNAAVNLSLLRKMAAIDDRFALSLLQLR